MIFVITVPKFLKSVDWVGRGAVALLLLAGCTRHPAPPAAMTHLSPARIEPISDFADEALGGQRQVLVWLPPGYDEQPRRRYPVLYLQDGQNVFDGRTAFKPGQEWRADETTDSLVRRGRIKPIILVAVYNGGERRTNEYTPTSRQGNGGQADAYLQVLGNKLKPLIDQRYRTLPGAAHTGIAGSSFGGLLAMYAVLRQPTVFGHGAALSASLWWDEGLLARIIPPDKRPPISRLYFDEGLKEDTTYMVGPARRALALLRTRGYRDSRRLCYFEDPTGQHDEPSWARRFGSVLVYLYGRQSAP